MVENGFGMMAGMKRVNGAIGCVLVTNVILVTRVYNSSRQYRRWVLNLEIQ